jgi:hypothetical protein
VNWPRKVLILNDEPPKVSQTNELSGKGILPRLESPALHPATFRPVLLAPGRSHRI